MHESLTFYKNVILWRNAEQSIIFVCTKIRNDEMLKEAGSFSATFL